MSKKRALFFIFLKLRKALFFIFLKLRKTVIPTFILDELPLLFLPRQCNMPKSHKEVVLGINSHSQNKNYYNKITLKIIRKHKRRNTMTSSQ